MGDNVNGGNRKCQCRPNTKKWLQKWLKFRTHTSIRGLLLNFDPFLTLTPQIYHQNFNIFSLLSNTSHHSQNQNTTEWIFAYWMWPRDPNHCDWLSGLPRERIVLGDWWVGSRDRMFSKVYRSNMLIKSGQTGLEPVRKQRDFLADSAARL